MQMKRLLLVIGLAWGCWPVALSAAVTPLPGTRSSEIGTFNGWSGWIGWEGSFSDTYEPIKEKYAWVVYFAPEAVYVALQPSQAVYSGVDVNMGIKYFYGFLKAPGSAQTLSANYVANLWSVSLSIGTSEWSPPFGPMSQLSVGLEVEQGFFRVQNTRTLLPGIQWGAGFGAAYSLLPISLPFTVELDRSWDPPSKEPAFSGFWPIVVWNRPVNTTQHPIDQIQSAFQDLATATNGPATAIVMAGILNPFLERIAADQNLRAFISNPTGNSSISQALTATETWLQSGDTQNLPDSLKPLRNHQEVSETVKPILSATQLAFEIGYRVGAQANPNNTTMYVEGVVTNYCYVGEKCTLEVRVDELLAVVPGRNAADFEGTSIAFDEPMEGANSYASLGQVVWEKISKGVARHTIAQSMSTPQLLGVRYIDAPLRPLNNKRDIELKRRLILFVNPADTNLNQIPDFWERQYGLTDNTPGADADKDGLTDLQEYLSATNPTNALDYLNVKISPATRELVLPFTSNVRHYVIQANTNSIANKASWINVMDFYGSDGEERIDLSAIFNEPKAFFRLKVTKP